MRVIRLLEYKGLEFRIGQLIKVERLQRETVIGTLTDFQSNDIEIDCSYDFRAERINVSTEVLISIEPLTEEEALNERRRIDKVN